MPEQIAHAPGHARLGIIGAEDHLTDPSQDDRTRALRAGLEGDTERGMVETIVTEVRNGPLDGQQLGVLGEIAPRDRLVVRARDDLAVHDDGGTDRHLAEGCSRASLGKGYLDAHSGRLGETGTHV
jgi:hypothetical protein